MRGDHLYFNDIKKDYIRVHYNLIKPYWANVQNNILSVPGMKGGHLIESQEDVLMISVPVTVNKGNFASVNRAKEDMAGWLLTKEPKALRFSDDVERTYYAKIDGEFEVSKKLIDAEKGVITFICPEPHKYATERTAILGGQGTIINVEGTASTKPIFELDITASTTYITVANDKNEYMMLGSPSRMNFQTYEQNTIVLNDTCTSLTGWAVADNVDNGYVAGNVLATPTGFIPETFGGAITPYAWQGPSIKTSLSRPLQDFRMDVLVEILNVGNGTGMIEIYLKDSANNIVAKIGIENVWRGTEQNQGKFQLGNLTNREQYYRQADYAPAWNNFNGMLRVYRAGNRFRPYFALIQPDGKHVWVSSSYVYTDYGNEYAAPITQVQVAMRIWPITEQADMTVKDIKVWEMNKQEEKVPYIANAGDKVIFNHQTGELLINGEDRKDIKDFGARYFDLKPGNNTFAILPDNVTGTVKWRPAYK